MPVRFLLGPAGSGKTRHCLLALRELEKAGRPGIYLVPEQFTYSADRELLDDPDLFGLRHVRVLSFTRFGWWLRELAAAPAPPAIPEAVRPMLLRAVLARMPEKTLGPLAALRGRQGFLEELSAFIREVRVHGAVAFFDAVRLGLSPEGSVPSATRAKIEALSAVFEAYATALRNLGRVDPEEGLTDAEPLIAGLADRIAPIAVFVDGFLSWTRREREVLAAVALTGARVEISLCCDGPEDLEPTRPQLDSGRTAPVGAPVDAGGEARKASEPGNRSGRADGAPAGAGGEAVPRLPFIPVARSHRELANAFRRAGARIEDPLCLQVGENPGSALERLERGLFSAASLQPPEPGLSSAASSQLPEPGLGSAASSQLPGPTTGLLDDPASASVCLQPARDHRSEVLLWARQIDRWTRLDPNPVRPGEVAVLVRGIEPYRDLVREIFPRYQIPVFLDERRSFLAHPRVRLLLDALEVILSGWRRDAVIAFLRNPLLGAPPASVDLCENLSLEFGWDFDTWTLPEWKEYQTLPRQRVARRAESVDEPGSNGGDEETEEAAEAHGYEDLGLGGMRESTEPSRAASESSGAASAEPSRAAFVDPLRRRLLFPLRAFEDAWPEDGRTGPEAAGAIRFLEEALVGSQGGSGALGATGCALEDPDPEWTARVDAVVDELLDEAGRLWRDVRVSLDEFARTLRQGCASARVGIPPLRLDQVAIGDVQRTRLHDVRRLIAGGLNDAVFPRAVLDDPILNEQDRGILGRAGLNLGPTAAERQEEEVYLFYIALTRASERLLLTWCMNGDKGESVPRSLFIEEVLRCLPDAAEFPAPSDPDRAAPDRLQTPGELGDRLVAELAGALRERPAPPIEGGGNLDRSEASSAGSGNGSEGIGSSVDPSARSRSAARPFFDENAVLRAVYNSTLRDRPIPSESERRQAVPQSLPALITVSERLRASLPALLYANEDYLPSEIRARAFLDREFTSSVTRLQQYAECPYQSFAQTQLGLVPRPVAQVSPLETGILAHAALDRFFRLPIRPGHAAIEGRLGEVFRGLEEIPELVAFRNDEASRYQWNSTRLRLVRYLMEETERLKESSYRPESLELSFGPGSGNPLAIPLATGDTLLLVGRIDRLDLRREQDRIHALVLDYKRSRKLGLPGTIERGLDLQLAAYLLFVRDVLGWQPSGGFYVPVLPGPARSEELKTEEVNPLGIQMHGIFLGAERDAIDGARNMLVRETGSTRQSLSSAGELNRLLEVARGHLASFAATWRSGWIAPRPLETKHELPCAYCDFAALCRFRPGSRAVRKEPAQGMLPGLTPK